VGRLVDHHDKLDAVGLSMSIAAAPRLVTCERGASVVEFALVLPALATLLIGGIYTGILMYSTAGLHIAVEQAARCYSVNASRCGSASAAQTYAQNQYYGMNSPAFTASKQACGHQVSGTVTVAFSAVLTDVTVPLSATACFP
jgi:Flp pilus assembly protein TadG